MMQRVRDRVLAAANMRIGPDGIRRTVQEDDELNELFAQTFREEGPQKVLAYLRSITIHNLMGPGASNDELRHMEGQRYLVAIIERRVENGRNRRRNAQPESKPSA